MSITDYCFIFHLSAIILSHAQLYHLKISKNFFHINDFFVAGTYQKVSMLAMPSAMDISGGEKFDLFNSIEKRHLQIFCHFLTMVFESAGAVLEN